MGFSCAPVLITFLGSSSVFACFFMLKPLPLVPDFVPSVGCPRCCYPNDEIFRFCQRCGYERNTAPAANSSPLKAPVDFNLIKSREKELSDRHASTLYMTEIKSGQGADRFF